MFPDDVAEYAAEVGWRLLKKHVRVTIDKGRFGAGWGACYGQGELTFNSALAGYEAGKVDFATLLDAQRQIRQAKQNQIKAEFEAQMRLAEIEKLLGEDL